MNGFTEFCRRNGIKPTCAALTFYVNELRKVKLFMAIEKLKQMIKDEV